MILVALVITLFGFIVSVLSLGMASAIFVRLAMVIAGIALSFVGIGMLTAAYGKNAVWRK